MREKAWIANPLAIGLLLLLVGAAPGPADADSDGDSDAEHGAKAPIEMSPEARLVEEDDIGALFAPPPNYDDHTYDADANTGIYRDKHALKTADPPILIGRRLYDRGLYTPRPTYLGTENPISASLMAYGDLRVAAAYNDNGVPGFDPETGTITEDTHQTRVAARLNLDLDLALTATERFHAFVRPLDNANSFTRYDIDGKVESEFTDELDFKIETLFFEGDLGAIRAGRRGESNNLDLPFAVGLVPVITQNGVWIEDAFWGAAFAITAKNSAARDISNYDLTFFIGLDKVTTDAVRDDNDAEIIGVAGFLDIWSGYLEFGYGYLHEDVDDFSYHNVTAAFSRRFGATLSNSVRVIGNFGQSPIPGRRKTADGVLLLIENSLISKKPITFVPYFNLFAGWDTPQSLARTADSGGVLRNTGITFETDGVTGYPTLDARGHDAYGGAFGFENLFALNQGLVVEVSYLDRHGELGEFLGAEYAVGLRYQRPISNAWIVRFDAMAGWRDEPLEDIRGARFELRRKF